MSTLSLSTETGETFSSISNNFIDFYMTDANGDFVKIYLYLVRQFSNGAAVSVADIADHFNCTEKDVCRAIRYWAAQEVLKFEYDSNGKIIGIVILNLKRPKNLEERKNKIVAFSSTLDEIAAEPVKPVQPVIEQPEVKVVPTKPAFDKNVLDSKLRDEDFAFLVNIASAYLKRTISQDDINSIIYMKDSLCLSSDIIEYLFEYCGGIDKTKRSYYEKVAVDWYSNDIKTVEDAKLYTERYNRLTRNVFKNLGIERRSAMTPSERAFIESWTEEFCFSDDIIIEACKRANLNDPNSANFSYVNGILTNWHAKGVKRLDDIKELDKEHNMRKKAEAPKKAASGFHNFMTRDNSNELTDIASMFLDEVNNGN